MISAHFVALQVAIPLLAAPACVILRRGHLAWLLATLVSIGTFVVTLLLLHTVLEAGALSYALGGWAAPWGIEYRVDVLNAFLAALVAGISSFVLLFARESAAREVDEDHAYLFYTAWLLCLTGLLGMAVTADAFNLFVFLEISSLSSYALVGLGTSRRSLIAAFRYLVLGTIGATFMLIGIGLIYMMTGTLNMADLAARLPAVADSRTVEVAFAFFLVGVGIKAAVFPLHFWLPEAYSQAPASVSALLAGTATKVSVYVMLRFLFNVFGFEFSFMGLQVAALLLPLALAGMLAMSARAIFQHDAKRVLAYSSVAQIGYMVLGITIATHAGIAASLLHLFHHALVKTCLFLCLGCVVYRTGSTHLENLAGLGRKMPLTMAAFTLAGIGLIGVPLTTGFVSKWYLILAALERGWWPAAVLVLIASLLAVVYVGRMIEVIYFRAPAQEAKDATDPPAFMLTATWALALAVLYFGIDTSFTTHVAAEGAVALMGTQN